MAKDRVFAPLRRRQVLTASAGALATAALLPWAASCGDSDASSPPPTPTNPAEALSALQQGNHRFYERKPLVRSTKEIERIWTEISMGQSPFASVLGCADSRLSPELIFDQFFGDIFVVREAGNIAGSATNLGSLEFSQAVLGVKLVLVLGHSACGAVRAALNGDRPGGNIQAVVDAIEPGIKGAATLDEAIADNVRATIATIRAQSAILRAAEASGAIGISGGVYDIASGVVTFL